MLVGGSTGHGFSRTDATASLQVGGLNLRTSRKEGLHRGSGFAGLELGLVTAEELAGFGVSGEEDSFASLSLERGPIVRLSVTRWLASDSGF